MAQMVLEIPDAAMTLLMEVCTDDGWNGDPATLGTYVQGMCVEYLRKRVVELKSRQASQQIQTAIAASIAEADAVLGNI